MQYASADVNLACFKNHQISLSACEKNEHVDIQEKPKNDKENENRKPKNNSRTMISQSGEITLCEPIARLQLVNQNQLFSMTHVSP